MATGRIGVTPVLRTRWSKLPTTGTTVLSGLDDNSVALVYDAGYEAVYRNGVLLSRGNDYTATNGTTITLIDATLAGDIVEVLANDLVPLTDAISKGQYNAKGALLSATAASTPAVLAVGSNDQVLTADSTTSTGLKWASAGAAATGYTLLNTGGTALSGASTVTVSGITKNELMIYVDNASTASGSTTLRFRFNSDSTSKYTTGGMFNKLRATFSGTGATATINGFNDNLNARTEIVFGEIASSGPSTAGGYLNVKGAATTSVKAFLAACGTGADTTGTDAGNYATGGFYTGTSAITTVSLISSSGNFDSGTIYVFERAI